MGLARLLIHQIAIYLPASVPSSGEHRDGTTTSPELMMRWPLAHISSLIFAIMSKGGYFSYLKLKLREVKNLAQCLIVMC